MLSQKTLADIVKDEVENLIRKGKIDTYFYDYYYILLDGKIYPGLDYDKEVEEGKRSPNDIYALVDVYTTTDFDEFLFRINYLKTVSVARIVDDYLRKAGFIIEHFGVFPPTPNLKYYIDAIVRYNNDTPEYLGIDIYDIDSLARTFRIPQIVEQKLGIKPRKITEDDAFDIKSIVAEKQPLLAGHTYYDAYRILRNDYVLHEEEYKDEAHKLALAYLQLFPTPYQVCYEWKAGIFIKTDCAKMVLHPSSS